MGEIPNEMLDSEITSGLNAENSVNWRKSVPSVSQLTRRIRGHLEGSFKELWVKGEISNFRRPASGHCYFILKDAKAQLRAVMFRHQTSRLPFQLKDGMEILLHGAITVYEARGDYQIVADAAEPVGVGGLQLAFEQLKEKLQKEGLFSKEHKKALPFLPKRIGVVTSSTGAAIRDILKVLHRRFENREVLILPAAVQGEKAAGEIVHQIHQASRWNEQHPERAIDALIVGRGGGSLEDLWPFNEEVVARAIFDCPIPIISAVGHEIDFTISDFVADYRAPTPSAAAEIVVPNKSELQYRVNQSKERLSQVFKRQIQQLKLHVSHLSQRIIDPREKLKSIKEDFKKLTKQLRLALKQNLTLSRHKLQSLISLLNSTSPLNTIARGFSLTHTSKGSLVKQIKDVKSGEILFTQVEDGIIESTVLGTRKQPLTQASTRL